MPREGAVALKSRRRAPAQCSAPPHPHLLPGCPRTTPELSSPLRRCCHRVQPKKRGVSCCFPFVSEDGWVGVVALCGVRAVARNVRRRLDLLVVKSLVSCRVLWNDGSQPQKGHCLLGGEKETWLDEMMKGGSCAVGMAVWVC